MDWKERMENIMAPAVGPTMDIVSDIFLDGVVGAVVPGIGAGILSYKQHKFEKNIEKSVSLLMSRMDELNKTLYMRDEAFIEKMKTIFLPMLLEEAIEVKQEEKIEFLVNGYVNTASIENPSVDIILGFQYVLEQLSILDIGILKSYYYKIGTNESLEDYWHIIQTYNIEESQALMIKRKLVRLGLLQDRNENQREDNIDAVYQYLTDINKGKKNVKLRGKKVSIANSFSITTYGRQFIEFYII